MTQRSVIVVVFDRWGAGQASPLGATMLDMPFFNRLAASALTANFCLADSPDLEQIYRSYWTGRHAADPRDGGELEHWLNGVDAHSLLVTDEPLVRDHPLARHFEQKLILPPSTAQRTADEVAQTQLAKLLFAAGEAILNLDEPHVVWIHAQAMEAPWDAPLELRQSLRDEEDPEPPEWVFPPSRRIEGPKNYDELLGISQAYGGQALALDEIWGEFIEVLDQRAAEAVENTLLVVTSPRGFPLGEHGVIGAGGNLLYSELLHVPLFLRFGRGRYGEAGALQRTSALIQPCDLAATIADWLDAEGVEAVRRGEASTWGRSVIPLATHPDPAALPPPLWRAGLAVSRKGDASEESYFLTPGWALRSVRREEGAEPQRELYAKPDDRWEVNEVSTRAVEECEEMAKGAAAIEQAISEGRRDAVGELSEALVRPAR